MFGLRRQPVVIGGKPIGRLRASWLLLKESWRFLAADTELLLVPIVTAIMMILLFGILLVVVLATGMVQVTSTGEGSVWSAEAFLFVLGAYLISAFTVSFAKAMVTHTVMVRANQRNATFGESFGVAFRHSPSLFVWSLISATVGMILRSISERSTFLARLVAGLLGAAWGVLTYFVVPAIVVDNKRPFRALTHSAQVFRRTWGETLVTNISLGLMFLVLHILAVVLFFACFVLSVKLAMPSVFVIALIVWIVWLFAAIAIEQILIAIITTLLYLYATATTPPANFNHELLDVMLARSMSAASGERSTAVVSVGTDVH
jgi:hypothetical protein